MADRRTEHERRATQERRRIKERKRYSENRVAVIEITENDLRVAILNRGSKDTADEVQGTSLRWREEADLLGSEQGQRELTAALRRICESQNLAGSQIRFVLSGKFCVTRALLGATEEVKSQLQQLQQRSQLYLLLGTGEKVIVSNSKPLDARHTYSVAAIANARTINSIHTASEQAGMFVESIEPALVSNSRVVDRLQGATKEPCLLIHLDRHSVEIGVSQTGRLMLEYRPGTCESPEDLVEVVRTHLNRLERHLGRMLRQAPPKLQKVYLTGECEEVEKARKALTAIQDMQVIVAKPEEIQATWNLSKTMENTATITLLGALLGTYLPAGETDAPNFMEHITAITREPIKPILLRSLVPLAAVLLIAVGLFFLNFRQQMVNEGLQEQLNELAAARTQTRELRLRMTASSAMLAQLERMLAQISSPPHAEMMRRIARCMPNDVWVNTLSVSDANTVKLRGSSYLEAGVFDFVKWLELAPGFEDVALHSTKSGHSRSGPTVDFDLDLTFSDDDKPITEVAQNE